MHSDLSAVSESGRHAPKRMVFRALAIGLTTALTVLFMPTSAFAAGGVPSAPAQPTITHGDGLMSVAFVAPADNGSAIEFYTADCTSSNGGAEGVTSDVASPVSVTGLDNGKTYTCTVTATNANGTSAASVASTSAVPAGKPDTPVKPTVTRGNAQISVAFVAPADEGSAITGYTAACTSSNGGTSGSQGGGSSPLVVTGLTNGKTYACTVVATNGEGDSVPSSPSVGTIPATVPGTPAQPTLVHGAAMISVSFVAPGNTGGAVITAYTASCSSSNGGAAGMNTGTASPIAVTALTNGKTYTCTIHATNAVGDSAESPASASTVPAATPDAPAQPTVTRGNAQISVAFVAPANNGSTITGFTAACTSSDGGVFGNNSGGTSPIVVSGLTNGNTYTCTVFATNGEGDGTPSTASATAVPAAVPSAPAQPTVTFGNTSISVAFVAPNNGGSAITGYTAACTSSDGGASGSNTGASSPIVVSSLTNGNTYTCTVFATNVTGNGDPSVASASTVPATVPGTPAQPTVTHGNASISVAFSAPGSTGGSAITGYTASCTSSNGGASGSNSGAGSPVVVSALTNGKTYTCVVHATNIAGNGLDSVASAAAVPATVPSAPAQPTISASGTTITVTFVAPDNGGSAITGYSASCNSSNGGTPGSNTGGSSPINVSSLSLGKSYTCTVHATNVEGDSTESIASAPATVPAVTPSTPAQPTVTRGAAAVSVAFVAPFDGGSAITGYTASCVSSDGGASGSNSGATSPVAVGSLTNGKTYTCTVHATNVVGDSGESPASIAVVPAAVPSAPAAPTLTHGNAQISVAFVAPSDNGNAITGYTASCVSSDGGDSGSNTGATSPIVVSALTNGNTYTCTVFATSAVGNGLASPASASTVPATVPSTPTAPTVTPGNAQMSVAFVAPANGGSAITGYTATCTSSDGGALGGNTGATSPITVGTLTNGKTYTCTVHATNGEGDSLESPASGSAVPATVPVAPAKPTTVAAATHIAVSFVAPVNGGSVITGYTASCVSSDGGVSGSNSGATSPISVQSLSKGNTYTCTVHATNADGDSPESPASNATVVPATVPDAPAQPITTFGNGQISVAFVAPNTGGSPITGYSANCQSSDGGTPGSHSSGASPIVVTGLDNGHTYTCTVLATNGLGDSDASIASAATVPATVPGTPDAPTLTGGDASISVAFVAPGSTGGSAITGYTASCVSSDGGAAGSNSGATSPIVVASLTNGNTYTCTVLATNVAGNGTASAASASVVPMTVPSAPAAPTLTHGNAQISVAFVAPGSTGGSAITGYTASCTSSDGGAAGSNTGATSPIVVASLTNGKTYTCTVLATNIVGDGLPSSASTSTVPATIPTTPAAPTLTRGDAQISVAFVAPATGGSPITGYTVSCVSSDGGTAGGNTGAASPIVVAALTNGKTYTCTVLATNVEGSSTASPVSTAVVPAAVPTAPARPTITRGNRRMTVAFAAPANGGAAITGYTAACVSSDGGASGTMSGATSPIVVTGLTNVKRYTCTVFATNGAGAGLASVASVSSRAGLVPVNTHLPMLSGAPIDHHMLTLGGGAWAGAPVPTFTRRWQRCDLTGHACVNIPGAVGTTYVLHNADVNHRIRIVVTATNALASAEAISAVTAKVTS